MPGRPLRLFLPVPVVVARGSQRPLWTGFGGFRSVSFFLLIVFNRLKWKTGPIEKADICSRRLHLVHGEHERHNWGRMQSDAAADSYSLLAHGCFI